MSDTETAPRRSRVFTVPDRASKPIVLDVQNLSVVLDDRVILHDVSFWIPKGEFVSLCGPNGAGKSTFLKTVLGLLRPTGGTIEILGKPPREGRSSVGYVPQRKAFDRDFPARAIDLIVAAMRGKWPLRITDGERDRAKAALERVGGAALIDKPIAALSGGETQRVFLARALVNDPALLISSHDLSVVGGVAAVAMILLGATWSRLAYATFDSELATLSGVPVGALDSMLLALVAVVIVVAVKTVGVALVSSFIVIPAATARMLGRTLPGVAALALVLGVLGAALGLLLSYHLNVASGASIILTMGAGFAVALLLRRR